MPLSAEDIRQAGCPCIAFASETDAFRVETKRYLFRTLYRSPKSQFRS